MRVGSPLARQQPDSQRTFCRSRMVCVGLFLAVGGIVLLVLQLVGYERDNNAHRTMALGVYLVPAVATLAMIVFGVRVASLRLVVAAEGLRVVRLLRSRWIPWSTVDRFDFDRTRLFKQVFTIVLSTGNRVPMVSLPVSSPSESWAVETMNELDRYLAAHRRDDA